jgi:GT2 family glycosyltransferase
VFAVSTRCSHNNLPYSDEECCDWVDHAGGEGCGLGITDNSGEQIMKNVVEINCMIIEEARKIFGVRLIAVRGPLLFVKDKLEALNYLDTNFTMDEDDHDICIRAAKRGWVSGHYPVNSHQIL